MSFWKLQKLRANPFRAARCVRALSVWKFARTCATFPLAMPFRPLRLVILLLACLAVSRATAGTLVKLDTPIGSMTFQLYDEAKPQTVANFLSYVTSGRYTNTFAHRLIPGFVLQGGGFGVSGNSPTSVQPFDPVVNEAGPFPDYSNVFGTIAMAKIPAEDGSGNPIPGGGPDSATSQWFINLGNNSTNLDNQNGGFTVFGSILSGVDVLQQLNTFTSWTGGSATDVVVNASGIDSNFTNLPVTYMDNTGQLYINALIATQWTVVPEPATAALLGFAGLVALSRIRRRRIPAPAAPALR